MRRAIEWLKSLVTVKGLESPVTGLDRSYLPELDSLRFFAFLLVYGFHKGLPSLGGWIRDIFAMTIDMPILLIRGTGGLGGPLGRAVDHALAFNGWIGVNLFFTLSGFIITRLLIQEERKNGRIDWSAFWMRRILRIWPLFYLIYFIGFAGLPFIGGNYLRGVGLNSPHAPWFALFLGNWSMIRIGPIGSDVLSVLWSVCVEEQFYVFIPIVLAVLGTRGRFMFCGLGIVAAIWRRQTLAASGVPQYMMTYDSLAQMDSLLSGVLLALILAEPRWRERAVRFTKRHLVWLVVPLTLFLLTRRHLGHEEPMRRVWDPVALWTVSVIWVLVASVGSPRWSHFLSRPIFVLLGKISYGLYMWHEVLLGRFGGGFGTLAATIVTAWLSYRFVERPMLKFKHRWSRVTSRPV